MEKFEIVVYNALYLGPDDENGLVLTPGTLTGHIHIQCKKLVKTEKITIALIGNFKSSWKAVKNSENNCLTYHYEKKEIPLINEKIDVWKQNMELFLDDRQTFPFEFKLGKQLPPSLTAPYSQISYYLEACIDQPKKSTRLNICLIPNVQLTFNPIKLEPVEYSTSNPIGVYPKNRRVDLKVKLAKSEYAIGENVNVELEVTNKYHHKIDRIDLFLVQEVVCLMDLSKIKWPNFGYKIVQTYENDAFIDNQKVMAKFTEIIEIKSGTTMQRNYSIKVPIMVPSFKNQDSGIEVRNYIRADAHLTKAWFNETVNCAIPITVGIPEKISELYESEKPEKSDNESVKPEESSESSDTDESEE